MSLYIKITYFNKIHSCYAV